MNKKIITIAEIVFALIFVVLLAVFMATINSKGNSANNQLVNTLESTGTTSLQNYEGKDVKGSTVVTALDNYGKDVKGSTVVTALDNYKSIGEELKLTMIVTTKATTADDEITDGDKGTHTGKAYGYKENGGEYDAYSASADDDDYINQSANFHCELVKNANDVVIGIHFVQEGETCTACAD